MKIENTLENKAKFFAQYWGQTVAIIIKGSYTHQRGRTDNVDENSISSVRGENFVKFKYSLELKPLSSITDEDLIKCYHLHSAFIGHDYTMDFRPVLEMATHWYTNGGLKNIIRCPDTVDFLRSRGYTLPWMGISVEQQVEWGWVKLKV